MTVTAFKWMLVLAYLCVYVSAWIYVPVYKNQSYCNRQKFYSNIVKQNNAKKVFLKRNKIFKAKKCLPLFHLEAKITKLKRSKKFEVKRSEKMDLNFWSEQAKHMQNGSNFASLCF
jgi:hypothetical protein